MARWCLGQGLSKRCSRPWQQRGWIVQSSRVIASASERQPQQSPAVLTILRLSDAFQSYTNGQWGYLRYCFLSYTNIQLPGKTTGEVGCKLTMGNSWRIEINSPGNSKVACGVVCICANTTSTSTSKTRSLTSVQSIEIEKPVCISMANFKKNYGEHTITTEHGCKQEGECAFSWLWLIIGLLLGSAVSVFLLPA